MDEFEQLMKDFKMFVECEDTKVQNKFELTKAEVKIILTGFQKILERSLSNGDS